MARPFGVRKKDTQSIGSVILDFLSTCRDNKFYADDLHHFVSASITTVSREHVLRVLRNLRWRGVIDYVTSRKANPLYFIVSVDAKSFAWRRCR